MYDFAACGCLAQLFGSRGSKEKLPVMVRIFLIPILNANQQLRQSCGIQVEHIDESNFLQTRGAANLDVLSKLSSIRVGTDV